MLSKSKRPYKPDELPPDKRFKANVSDLFAQNALPATRAHSLLQDAHAAGVASLHAFQRPAGSGGNASSFLKRCLLKRNQWPPLYLAEVRVLNKETHLAEMQHLAFMLPHELIEVLDRLGSSEIICSSAGLDPLSKRHWEHCKLKANAASMVPLGLWGDGVPCNWDRTESVEVVSLNLPGQGGQYKNLRLPVTALSRKLVTDGTWDDIMAVVAWSLQYAAIGKFPAARHNGSPWLPSDVKRANKENSFLKGCLVEVRGDWKFFGETFCFPKWNTKAGMCWRCTCTPEEVLTDKMTRFFWFSLQTC